MIRLFILVLFILQRNHGRDPGRMEDIAEIFETRNRLLREERERVAYMEKVKTRTQELFQHLTKDTFLDVDTKYNTWYTQQMQLEVTVPANYQAFGLPDLKADLKKVNEARETLKVGIIVCDQQGVSNFITYFLKELPKYLFLKNENLDQLRLHLMAQHLMSIMNSVYYPTMQQIRQQWPWKPYETVGDIDTIQVPKPDPFYDRLQLMMEVYTRVQTTRQAAATFNEKVTANTVTEEDAVTYVQAIIEFQYYYKSKEFKEKQVIPHFKARKIYTGIWENCEEAVKDNKFDFDQIYIRLGGKKRKNKEQYDDN